MNIDRREFLRLLTFASAAGLLPLNSRAANEGLYNIPARGDVRLLHITDTHAQLKPVYFREPSVNLGFHDALGKAPHLTGARLLERFKIVAGSHLAHAFTSLNFTEAANQYGKVGGFAYLKTLIDDLRDGFGSDKTLLLDGGDTWQGSGTALWTRGKDMVAACNLLGVDVMTGHWEFTYRDGEVLENIAAFKGDFVAQNVKVKEDALFDGSPAYDEDSGHALKPYVMKNLGGHRIAVIGQAFPYTPVANPSRFIPDWTFGINDGDLQELVDEIRSSEKPSAVIVLSHNGMDVDLKMASRVTGIDAILGGHTHDGIPAPIEVKNANGITLVTNAGCNGKFVGVLDLKLGAQGVSGYYYKLLPVFSNLLKADPAMASYIETMRKPWQSKLEAPLAVAGELLYRRGNFNGTFDQVICDALRMVNDVQISLSPGFRWGTSVLPGQTITMEHVLDQTCITYPETYVREMSGKDLKAILEDVGDNLFNPDPYYQQGGDMVRLGGLDYRFDPLQAMGKRVSEMTLDNGEKIQAGKNYKVAGWATVGSQSAGEPIWDTVATYLRDVKTVNIKKMNTPVLLNAVNNPGISNG
ncbi:thiosulfohydrolase SoxB [Gammaproteobacteria bacterium 53_120_T64]|nr:thiosulfohydrolase SoxB [Gammaproteobacteria bacterium 53_120_T64]